MTAFFRTHVPGVVAAVIALVIGAAGQHFAAGLTLGTLDRPGPGVAPLFVSYGLIVFGVLQLAGTVRSVLVDVEAGSSGVRASASWMARSVAAVALALAFAMTLAPSSSAFQPWLLHFGPPEFLAWYVLLLTLGVVAIWLSGAAPLTQMASSVLIGLLLATAGADVDSAVVRYVDIEFTFVHGLLIAVVARALGFSAVLIAIGYLVMPHLEQVARTTMVLSRGDPWMYLSRPLVVGFLAAALAALAIGIAVRWITSR